jgi:hypothetical protein
MNASDSSYNLLNKCVRSSKANVVKINDSSDVLMEIIISICIIWMVNVRKEAILLLMTFLKKLRNFV